MSTTSNLTPNRNIKQRVKDYAVTAFKNLQSQFGTGGGHGHTPSQPPSPTSFTQSHIHHHPSPSQASLANLRSQFGAEGTHNSYTPSQPPSPTPSTQSRARKSSGDFKRRESEEKDYNFAFASLQTQFGIGGHIPCQSNLGYDNKHKPGKA